MYTTAVKYQQLLDLNYPDHLSSRKHVVIVKKFVFNVFLKKKKMSPQNIRFEMQYLEGKRAISNSNVKFGENQSFLAVFSCYIIL